MKYTCAYNQVGTNLCIISSIYHYYTLSVSFIVCTLLLEFKNVLVVNIIYLLAIQLVYYKLEVKTSIRAITNEWCFEI